MANKVDELTESLLTAIRANLALKETCFASDEEYQAACQKVDQLNKDALDKSVQYELDKINLHGMVQA